jgi:hypothetical protein
MATEQLKASVLARSLSDVIADIADLIQKEMRLARSEVSGKLSLKLHGGAWMAAAGGLAVLVVLLVVEAVVFEIASTGIRPCWACLIVAGGLGIVGGAAFYRGRVDARGGLAPVRTIRQLKRDVAVATEQVR